MCVQRARQLHSGVKVRAHFSHGITTELSEKRGRNFKCNHALHHHTRSGNGTDITALVLTLYRFMRGKVNAGR